MPLAPDPTRAEPRLSAALPALFALALALAIGTMSIFLFSIVQEAAKAELGLTDNQLGFIQGVGAAAPRALPPERVRLHPSSAAGRRAHLSP